MMTLIAVNIVPWGNIVPKKLCNPDQKTPLFDHKDYTVRTQ
jgi:hypothetical protein